MIKSAALDDILKSFNPDTIVMDVEGAEVELAIHHWPVWSK